MSHLVKVQVRNAERILDLGCGDGNVTIRIAEACCAKEVFGVDVDDQALQQAQRKGMTVVKADLNVDKLPFQANYFDLVIMAEVIEHLLDPDHALQQVQRVLKPGGYLLLTTPNLGWYVNRLVLLFGYQPYWTGCGRYNVGKFMRSIREPAGHLRLYTMRALKQMLILHNFMIVTIKGSTTDLLREPLRTVDDIIARIRSSMAQILIVLARKVSTYMQL